MPSALVLDVGERGLALRAERHEPAGDGDRGAVLAHGVIVRRERLGGGVGAREAIGEGRDAHRLQGRALLPPRRLDVGRFSAAGHAALLPKRLRYAWMNSSRSPSITLCTSPTLSSVRWSLTIVYGWKT